MNNTTPPQPPFPPVPPFAPFPPRPYPPPPPPMPYHPSIHRDSDCYTRKEVDDRDAATLAAAENYADTKYSKPASGIPASDLASGVQASLGKADTALQEHQSLDGYATEEWVGEQGFLTEHQSLSGYVQKSETSGLLKNDGSVDTNTYLTEHQSLSGCVQKSVLFDNPDTNPMVKSALLPSYVDDVLEYASTSGFPSSGETGKIYVALDTNKTYRWGGSEYVQVGGGELPALATVATTGDYDDLINKPTALDPTAHASTHAAGGDDELDGSMLSVGGESQYASSTIASAVDDIDTRVSDKVGRSELAAVATTGDYGDLLNKPTIPAAQVQADWNQSDNTKVDFIKNKPSIPSSSDFVAKSGAQTMSGSLTTSSDGGFGVSSSIDLIPLEDKTSYLRSSIDFVPPGSQSDYRLMFPANNGTLALQEGIAPAFSSSSTYAVGDYVTHEGLLYKCTTAVSTAGAWNAANWTATNAVSEGGGDVNVIETVKVNGVALTPDANKAVDINAVPWNNSSHSAITIGKRGSGSTVGATSLVVAPSSAPSSATSSPSVAMGLNCSASGLSSVALGQRTTAGNNNTFAAGYRGRANNGYTFVWQGSESSGYYDDKGRGTFCINPAPASGSTDPATGFWIGEKKLTEVIAENTNYLAYASTTTLAPETAVYRSALNADGTFPTITDTGIPTAAAYYQFELELAVPSTVPSTITGPTGWTWLDGHGLPDPADLSGGETIYISVRLDCTARTFLASVWRVA